ncbi:MAG: pilus assembly protein [Novosphingobium sp.]|jgi:Flp pilus assembly protein TadG|nr:pilus assembly protein [Novosphingobium sp.]MBP6555147.1 pilus assembly protein [Novosphingobium sp.]
MRQIFLALLRRQDGSAVVEFALLGPIFLGLFMGVLQVGIGMQNYNALRGLSGDVARRAVVTYQTGVRPDTGTLETWAENRAAAAPYGLRAAQFNAQISSAATQRVTGAIEYTITLTYTVPTLLSVIGVDDIPLTYTRPVFVVTS